MSKPSALEVVCASLGALIGEQTRLEAELAALQDEIQAEREVYDRAWHEELHARLDAAGLSWCTYCDAIVPVEALVDGFTVDWHTEGYDPEAFWRYTEWYRCCPDCMAKKTFAPKPAVQYAEHLAKNPHGPMWERDHRQDAHPRKSETLDELTEMLGLPPRWERLREMKDRAAWSQALVVEPAPLGPRGRPSPLASRSS